MEKLTKAELKSPDLFIAQTSKATLWGIQHKTLIISAASLTLLLGLAWSGWGMYRENTENKAQTELYKAQKATSSQEALQKLVDTYPSTQAAVFAALDYAKTGYGQKKYDENIKILTKVKGTPRKPIIRAMTYNALALNYEAKGDCKAAIDLWNQIEGRDDMTFMYGPVYIKKALCYENLGQKEEALKMYKKAEALSKNPEIAKMAKKYSRLIK